MSSPIHCLSPQTLQVMFQSCIPVPQTLLVMTPIQQLDNPQEVHLMQSRIPRVLSRQFLHNTAGLLNCLASTRVRDVGIRRNHLSCSRLNKCHIFLEEWHRWTGIRHSDFTYILRPPIFYTNELEFHLVGIRLVTWLLGSIDKLALQNSICLNIYLVWQCLWSWMDQQTNPFTFPHQIINRGILFNLSSVGWRCRIHRLHLCREVRTSPHPTATGYDTKWSDGEVPVVLSLW